MSVESQKVVVILDASADVSWVGIQAGLQSLSFNPGDELTILGVLHKVNSPSTLSFKAAGNLMGCKSRVGSRGLNLRTAEDEVERKREEYLKEAEKLKLSKKCEMDKIKLRIEVLAGASRKVVALKAARSLEATWVILDREMKKEKRFFMEKLSCGVSRMKRHDKIEQLRGPKSIEHTKVAPSKSASSPDHVSYGEMIPGNPEEDYSPETSPSSQAAFSKGQGSDVGRKPPRENIKKSASLSKSTSTEQTYSSAVSTGTFREPPASSSNFTNTKNAPFVSLDEKNLKNSKEEAAGEQTLYSLLHGIQLDYLHLDDEEEMEGHQQEDEFENSICSVCKNRRPKIGCNNEFTYAGLYEATNGFSPNNYLSEGGFGSVYSGELRNGRKIAVKQHKDVSFQGEREFKSEVLVLSKARHQNLVMLLGSCSEGSHRLLVYEYVCNGSLDQHLSKQAREPLNWYDRIKVALGAARGLEYLHKHNIVHRDMRPNNILVTHDHEALVGDFGLARAQHGDLDNSEPSVVGTLGYVAPEYAESGKVSTKTDVYSFGVVLLQLITGKMTTDNIPGGEGLVEWARPLLEDRMYPDLIDPRIVESHDVHQLFWMVRVTEECLRKDPRKRCNMERVVNTLNYIKEGTATSVSDFGPTKSEFVNSVVENVSSDFNEEAKDH